MIFLGIILVLLGGCSTSAPPTASSSATPVPATKVIVQGVTEGKEITQTIDLNNCDGKSDAVRTEEYTTSVEVTVSAEMAASVGVSAEVISAEAQSAVTASLSQSGSKTTSIQLTAPPGTHMSFQITWVGSERVGVVQNVAGLKIPVAFRSFEPSDVRIKSQFDIGCPRQPDFQEVVPSPTTVLPTMLPSTGARWLQEVSQIPESGTQLSWHLSAGQVLFLSGGQFQIGEVFCGGSAQQVCVLIYKASTDQTLVVNSLVPRQNYVGVTESLSPEEALRDKEPMFWLPPNCVSGCQRATVLFFTDGKLVNKVSMNAP